MTETPRTDATEKHAYQFDDDMTPVVDSKFARQLERELADVTKQRDALVEACSLTLKRGDIVQRSDQYMREVLSVNRSALAAVKGGGT
jgi:hypothetical protein